MNAYIFSFNIQIVSMHNTRTEQESTKVKKNSVGKSDYQKFV